MQALEYALREKENLANEHRKMQTDFKARAQLYETCCTDLATGLIFLSLDLQASRSSPFDFTPQLSFVEKKALIDANKKLKSTLQSCLSNHRTFSNLDEEKSQDLDVGMTKDQGTDNFQRLSFLARYEASSQELGPS